MDNLIESIHKKDIKIKNLESDRNRLISDKYNCECNLQAMTNKVDEFESLLTRVLLHGDLKYSNESLYEEIVEALNQ